MCRVSDDQRRAKSPQESRYNQIVGDPAEKSLSILRKNSSAVARDFVGPLDHSFLRTKHGMQYSASLAGTLNRGLSPRFGTDDPTIRATLETRRMPIVNRESIEVLVAHWEDALPRLRRQNCQAQATAEITDRRYQQNIVALDYVEGLLNEALKPLASAFAEHPEVHCIRLDGFERPRRGGASARDYRARRSAGAHVIYGSRPMAVPVSVPK